MKRLITIIISCAICMTMTLPAYAAPNYDFGSGPDSRNTFGKPTSNDEPVSPEPMSENIRRNKDAAVLPPPYFYGSGHISTDTSSLYHDNTPSGNQNGFGGSSVSYGDCYSSYYSSETGVNTNYGSSSVNISVPTAPGFQVSTSSVATNIAPLYYDDGSIGTIYVERINKTITVYEGESLENMKKGAGHFSGTSVWDGNVVLCGHNRGSSAFFSFVKDMKMGDRITYTTKYGTRTYEVINKEQIGEYDYSKLAWSVENLLNLITCVENSPAQRWAATLREVR